MKVFAVKYISSKDFRQAEYDIAATAFDAAYQAVKMRTDVYVLISIVDTGERVFIAA